MGQRPQEIRRAKGCCQEIRPNSHYRSCDTAGSWDALQDAGNSHCSTVPKWGSSRGAGACLQSPQVHFGRQGPELVAIRSLRQMKQTGQAEPAGTRSTACSPRYAGRAGRQAWDGLGWPGCGHCRLLQGQQPMGGQRLHKVGLRAQPLCRWAGQGLSLGPKSRDAVEVPFVPWPARA